MCDQFRSLEGVDSCENHSFLQADQLWIQDGVWNAQFKILSEKETVFSYIKPIALPQVNRQITVSPSLQHYLKFSPDLNTISVTSKHEAKIRVCQLGYPR